VAASAHGLTDYGYRSMQRHRLPVITASMSSSLGLGVSCNNGRRLHDLGRTGSNHTGAPAGCAMLLAQGGCRFRPTLRLS